MIFIRMLGGYGNGSNSVSNLSMTAGTWPNTMAGIIDVACADEVTAVLCVRENIKTTA